MPHFVGLKFTVTQTSEIAWNPGIQVKVHEIIAYIASINFTEVAHP